MVQIGLRLSSVSSTASWMSAGTSWPAPQTKNRDVVRRARAYVDAHQDAHGAWVAAAWQRDDPIPAFAGEEQRRRLVATPDRLSSHRRLGSPAAAAGRQAR